MALEHFLSVLEDRLQRHEEEIGWNVTAIDSWGNNTMLPMADGYKMALSEFIGGVKSVLMGSATLEEVIGGFSEILHDRDRDIGWAFKGQWMNEGGASLAHRLAYLATLRHILEELLAIV